jgi:hypothetical protein
MSEKKKKTFHKLNLTDFNWAKNDLQTGHSSEQKEADHIYIENGSEVREQLDLLQLHICLIGHN